MLFNSYTFWIFFGLVALLYRFLDHRRRNHLLLLASYVFYGYWDWRFLGLIAISTLIDFVAAQRIADAEGHARRRKAWLMVSISANLGLLGIFKYLGFFVTEFNTLMERIGLAGPLPGIDLILPVGISFYTFQTLSYTIDVYRGHTQPARGLMDFSLYVTFFPQLVAGPIERSSHLLPQVVNPRKPLDGERFREGLYYVLNGLFRKVVIADNMALIANHVFSQPPGELSGWQVMLGVYAFAFQIYGDFSGYSSIAQGTAKWLGFDLMDNFRNPYFAKSPQEFWQRWHISLSSWLRDYLYIPLGGNRNGTILTYRNLTLTMLLGGLWHGAAWTFVIWGAIHGLWLAAHRLATSGRGRDGKAVRGGKPWALARMLVTFHIVCLCWLFFRADSAGQAVSMLGQLSLGGWQWGALENGIASLMALYLAPLLAYEFWCERKGDLLALTRAHWGWRAAAYLYILWMILFFGSPVQQEFIYFRF
ncbi:MBOAT family protein [Akkermansiaceae bacterium]|nr:MBOAT family protein [Akkermansiaceae bacterium]